MIRNVGEEKVVHSDSVSLKKQFGHDVKEKGYVKTVFHLVALSQFTKKKTKNVRTFD